MERCNELVCEMAESSVVALKNGFKNYIRYFDVERRCKNVVELDTGFENDIMESELGASLLE